MKNESNKKKSSSFFSNKTWNKYLLDKIDSWMPLIVVIPTILITIVFIYGFILWTLRLSFSSSTLFPLYNWVGLEQYEVLFASERWWVACKNIFIFGSLMISISVILGLLLAIFLDQKIRIEGFLRTIYLYPMSLSFIVTGVSWKWLLNPSLGIERIIINMGFTDFSFDWLIIPEKAIYTVVMAGVWQTSGFIMALFLAGLRKIDDSIIFSAKIDGANLFSIYTRIIIPSLRPIFLSALLILLHLVIKSFDLVVALTNGGPGYATDLPAVFMYAHSFTRDNIGLGSSSAIMILGGVLAIMVPYLYSEIKKSETS